MSPASYKQKLYTIYPSNHELKELDIYFLLLPY